MPPLCSEANHLFILLHKYLFDLPLKTAAERVSTTSPNSINLINFYPTPCRCRKQPIAAFMCLFI